MAKIERINTDGTNRVVLIQSGLQWPNGLTHDGKYLYWADAYFDKIEMSDLNVSLFEICNFEMNRSYSLLLSVVEFLQYVYIPGLNIS